MNNGKSVVSLFYY